MNWKIKSEKISVDKEKGGKINPIILQLLANRGISGAEARENFFHFNYEKNISDPTLFSEMSKAVDRIGQARKKEETIAIFGDYDADGVTATALLFETLDFLGCKKIIPYIPDRQTEGYGMNLEALNFLQTQKASLIITVDCGITNISEVEKAQAGGMDVIITDHHHVPDKIPAALAVINPGLEKNNAACRNLSGVGVAFKLAQALLQKFAPEKTEQIKWLLDLVAIGTIADCVPLLGENRVLVKYGLIVLSKTRRIGLLEMFKVGRINIGENEIPDTHKVAFQIAPRINAAGRMDHASSAYKLMIEKDRVQGRSLALEVESRNQERQKITSEIVKEVRIIAENNFSEKKFIFAAHAHWPVGILGLIAGKVADEFKKPTLIMREKENELVGSLRSIPEINIIETLEKCAEFLEKFGGHAQAAGITLKKENLAKFCQKMTQYIEADLQNQDLSLRTEVDMEIRAADIHWELMQELKRMEPFGEGNSEPIFLLKNLQVEEMKIVGNGSKHLKLQLRARDGGPKIFEAIYFGKGEEFSFLEKGAQLDVAFHLCADEWNGSKKIQLKIVQMEVKK